MSFPQVSRVPSPILIVSYTILLGSVEKFPLLQCVQAFLQFLLAVHCDVLATRSPRRRRPHFRASPNRIRHHDHALVFVRGSRHVTCQCSCTKDRDAIPHIKGQQPLSRSLTLPSWHHPLSHLPSEALLRSGLMTSASTPALGHCTSDRRHQSHYLRQLPSWPCLALIPVTCPLD